MTFAEEETERHNWRLIRFVYDRACRRIERDKISGKHFTLPKKLIKTTYVRPGQTEFHASKIDLGEHFTVRDQVGRPILKNPED